MKLFITLFLIFFCTYSLISQVKDEYAVSNIPDSLLVESGAVIRLFDMNIKRLSISESKTTLKYAATIFNEEYLNLAMIAVPYNQYVKVKSFNAVLYDEDGNKLKRIKKNDLLDLPAYEAYTLFSDHRMLLHHTEAPTYPFTIFYEFELNSSYLPGIPSWKVFYGYNVGVEKSNFTYHTPKEWPINYKELNFTGNFQKSSNKNEIVYSWQAKNLNGFKKLSFSPPLSEIIPVVHFSPGVISIDGYEGSTENWLSLGNWIHKLNKGRLELSNEVKNKLDKTVEGINEDQEKARRIYSFLQDNTRYVGIQLGIGGLQPIDANTVGEMGYGDCKALTNFMKAMLEYVGIYSIYSIIGTNENSRIAYSDLASLNQGNHVILCIPEGADTTWLECTNQNIPYGYIGEGNMDTYTLLIEKNNSRIVKTPPKKSIENSISSKVLIDINPDLSTIIQGENVYNGLAIQNALYFEYLSPNRQKSFIANYFDLNNPDIISLEYVKEKFDSLEVMLRFKFETNKLSKKLGKRIVFPISNFTGLNITETNEKKERKYHFHLEFENDLNSEVYFNLPQNYKVEYLPSNRTIENEFGSISTLYRIDPDSGNLHLSFRYSINEGNYPPEKFESFKNYMKEVSKCINEKIILIRKS